MAKPTKNNHSFPRCLIRQWINAADHKFPNNVMVCDKNYNTKERGIGKICQENNQYTQNTETKTCKDDQELWKYVKEIDAAEKIDESLRVAQNPLFLQLVYKLLCRVKTVNNLFVKETYNNLTFAKELYAPGKFVGNGLTTDKLLKQAVNFHLLVRGNDDWTKMGYCFLLNKSNRKFVLADDIKRKFVLSLSPNCCVCFSLNNQIEEKNSVVVGVIEDDSFVIDFNKSMLENSDEYVVYYDKKDLNIT